SGSLEERIAFWIIALTQRDGKDITFSCRQRDLYTLFGVQRSSFINTLEGMKARGLIDYSTTEIRVLSRNDLRSVLLKTPD
ncbi:MAG: helix-turn-helix domain-containing protein, partial [Duncaniella sp.]|nr:helix-turn-helix domain-containing protein [Duncaniella sp.]